MYKIKQCRLINMQSIEDYTFNFSEGLNVFRGRSNRGKSVMFKVFRKMAIPNFWGRGNNRQLIRRGTAHGQAVIALDKDYVIFFDLYPTYQMYHLFSDKMELIGSWKDNMPDTIANILGWYIDLENRYLLNLIDHQIPLPYVDSPPKFNYDVLRFTTHHDDLDVRRNHLQKYSFDISNQIAMQADRLFTLGQELEESKLEDISGVEHSVCMLDSIIKCLEALSSVRTKVEDLERPILPEGKKLDSVYNIFSKVSEILKDNELQVQPKKINKVGNIDCVYKIYTSINVHPLPLVGEPKSMPAEVEQLIDLVEKIDYIQKSSHLPVNCEEISLAYRIAEEELEAIKKELVVCSFCGKPL